MGASSLKDTVFPARKESAANDRWTHTNAAAREIIRNEAAARDAKTAKLREQRIAREAEEPPVKRPASRRKQKKR